NDDAAPVTLSVTDVSANEGNAGTTPFTFTVSLSAVSSQTVTVNYATADGSATVASGDYQATSGTLTFAPGQTSQTVTVLVNANTINQPNRTFFLNLSSPVNVTLARSQATGTIVDDDPTSTYQFSQPHATSVDDMYGQGTFTQYSSYNTNYTLSVRKFTGYVPQGTPYDERSVLEYGVH